MATKFFLIAQKGLGGGHEIIRTRGGEKGKKKNGNKEGKQ
jgi:hypothetical protein